MTAELIDADVHAVLPSIDPLLPHLPEHWADYLTQSGFGDEDMTAITYPPLAPTSGPTGADAPGLAELQAHLDEWSASLAVVSCYFAVESVRNPDLAAALASAVNDWLIAEWLERDPRLRGSIVVAPGHPDVAAREVERVGGHPQVAQLLLPVRSEAPYGNRRFHVLLDAAVAHGLAVALQFGGAPGVPPTANGWPSHYIEEHVGMPLLFQTQLTSLIAEGAFERSPELRVLVSEGGFAWLAPYLWRLTKEWKGLRREVPWVRRAPAEYVREHVRFTLQPIDTPDLPRTLARLHEQVGADDLVLFATDFPHRHAPASADVVAALDASDDGRRVLARNARAFHRL